MSIFKMVDNFVSACLQGEHFEISCVVNTENCLSFLSFFRGFRPSFQVYLVNQSSTFIAFDDLGHCVKWCALKFV